MAASRRAAKEAAEEAEKAQNFNNRYIAKTIMKAKRAGDTPFPSNEIESLVDIAKRVVAENFHRYPHLKGVGNEQILDDITRLTDYDLPITVTARNINQEFYWEEKCKRDPRMKNVKKEQHGNSYKQAYIEVYIQNLLENLRSDNVSQLIRDLDAVRYEVFSLTINELQHFKVSQLFSYLPNLAFLKLTYGAKHVGMQYERPMFGMKMSDAIDFSQSLRTTTSLTHLALPGNLIDDELTKYLVSELMLNKTISQLDLSHNKIGNQGARKIAKYILQTQILTHLNLGDNCISYDGSRFLAQALKVNKSLVSLDLKLNRLNDKAGSKLCIDLLNNDSSLHFLGLSSNELDNMFAESLAEYLKMNENITAVDISCNVIQESAAATLKDSLIGNPNITEIDVRSNHFSAQTVQEINEIVTKNHLKKKQITYHPMAECKFVCSNYCVDIGKVTKTIEEYMKEGNKPQQEAPNGSEPA